jgi:hypothetical protein
VRSNHQASAATTPTPPVGCLVELLPIILQHLEAARLPGALVPPTPAVVVFLAVNPSLQPVASLAIAPRLLNPRRRVVCSAALAPAPVSATQPPPLEDLEATLAVVVASSVVHRTRRAASVSERIPAPRLLALELRTPAQVSVPTPVTLLLPAAADCLATLAKRQVEDSLEPLVNSSKTLNKAPLKEVSVPPRSAPKVSPLEAPCSEELNRNQLAVCLVTPVLVHSSATPTPEQVHPRHLEARPTTMPLLVAAVSSARNPPLVALVSLEPEVLRLRTTTVALAALDYLEGLALALRTLKVLKVVSSSQPGNLKRNLVYSERLSHQVADCLALSRHSSLGRSSEACRVNNKPKTPPLEDHFLAHRRWLETRSSL